MGVWRWRQGKTYLKIFEGMETGYHLLANVQLTSLKFLFVKQSVISTGQLEEFLKHEIPNYLFRDTDL